MIGSRRPPVRHPAARRTRDRACTGAAGRSRDGNRRRPHRRHATPALRARAGRDREGLPRARRAVAAVWRHHLPLAAADDAARGIARARTHEGERRRRRGVDDRARAVRDRRNRDRIHARSDGDPLRGRARAGGQGRAHHRAVEEHRVLGGKRRRADPVADPWQVGGRHRNSERRSRRREPR